MPRQPDPDLEDRILKAAGTLWQKGGEKALTMRAVARSAGTNTPAVYRRFRNRKDILRTLLLRIREEVIGVLQASATPQEACDLYLDYALSHAHEYELFYQREYELLSGPRAVPGRGPVRPGVEVMRKKLADTLGGTPADHADLSLSLWMVAHGAAMLMIGKTIPPENVAAARSVFATTVETLLRAASRRRGSAG